MNERDVQAALEVLLHSDVWICDDGEPLDYLPERATRLADFIYQAAAAVVDLADDELDRQAKMRATGYEGQLIRAIRRAEAAEAKVARVEALHKVDEFGLCIECRQGFPCDTVEALDDPA